MFGALNQYYGTYINNSTNLRQTPEAITAWIFSFGPSDKYDKAQQASANTSGSDWYVDEGSLLKSKRARIGRHVETWKHSEDILKLPWSLIIKTSVCKTVI